MAQAEPWACRIEEDLKCDQCGFVFDIRCPMCGSREVAVVKKRWNTFTVVCTRCESISTMELAHIDGHNPPAQTPP